MEVGYSYRCNHQVNQGQESPDALHKIRNISKHSRRGVQLRYNTYTPNDEVSLTGRFAIVLIVVILSIVSLDIHFR